MELTGERIYLRPPMREDAKFIARILNSEKIYATTYGLPREYTVKYARWWIEFVKSTRRNKTGYEMLILTHEGRYVGNCAINNISISCSHGNLTYLIDPELWGMGYATEAAGLMLDFGFRTLGLERISGICMAHNVASEQVMRKLGLQYEGLARHEIVKDGKFIDVKHFGILREDFLEHTGEDRKW